MNLIWILLAMVVVLAVFAVFHIVLKRRQDDEQEDDLPECKESCDIHATSGKVVRYECGHDDASSFKINLWGEQIYHRKARGPKRFCSACLLQRARATSIRCGSCGYAIMPGDPVSACVDDPRIGKKEWRTVVDGQLLLCLRRSCDSALGFCGYWTGEGISPAYSDGRTLIGHAFASGKAMVMHIPMPPDREK